MTIILNEKNIVFLAKNSGFGSIIVDIYAATEGQKQLFLAVNSHKFSIFYDSNEHNDL